MKIGIVSQNVSPGILKFRKDLILALVDAGHQVFAFAVDYEDDSKKEVEELGCYPVEYTLSRTGLNPFRDLKDSIKLYSKIKRIGLDVVFSSFLKPSIYATVAASFAGVPYKIAMLEGLGYIHTCGPGGFGYKKRFLQRLHGLLVSFSYAFANKVVFLNHDDPVDLAKYSFISKKKQYVLGGIGLDLNEYSYSEVVFDETVKFIFVGRLLREKGIYEYLNAAYEVKRHRPQAEFLLLGGIDIENPSSISNEELQSMVRKGVVNYSGHVSDVSEWIERSSVFVLPSYREGMPRSTQEAMSIGRAILTTDAPGCRETVEDGYNGFIVPPYDHHYLSRKMIYLIDNRSEILRMGRNSHSLARSRFDVDKINSVLLSIIEERV